MTKAQTKTLLGDKEKRAILIVSAFVLLNLVSYVINPDSLYWKNYLKRDILWIMADFMISLTFCVFISESSIKIHHALNKVISWTERPGKRLAVETAANLLVVTIGSVIVSLIYQYLELDDYTAVVSFNMTVERIKCDSHWMVVSAIIAVIIMGINTGNSLINSWKNEAVRAAELNQAAMEAELHSLKLQIDPHFVFNNLSVLSELILEDQQLGYEYAENFSKIYRYLLINAQKDVIELREELKFLEAYTFLIRHRIGQGVCFDIRVDASCLTLQLPPLTLQLLVENALKHNRTNSKHPLVISIYTSDKQELVVENLLLPIDNPIESSRMGISNIVRRYRLMSVKEPLIVKDENCFKVILPLLK